MDSEKLLSTHEHPLTLVAGKAECKACNLHTRADHYYRCNTCEPGSKGGSFHIECITHYSEITHPYHPIHPLQFFTREFGEIVNNCFWCNRYMGYAFYGCSICNLNIHLFCASQQQLVLTLDPGKDHHHPLTIFPRRMYFTCNFCARIGEWFPIYACVQCDLMVHRHCLGLSRVIRISCHEHRISRRLYLPPGERTCGVCHFNVDPRYGAFFCTKGCSYAVHTECAKLGSVWDERELEDVPEDVDELKDVEPYEVIGDNLIKHFSHDHYLRFVLNLDGSKKSRCKACNLFIQSDNFYMCDLCDFILHQECANFKRRRWHPRHPHPLTLKADDDDMTLYYNYSGRRGFYSCCMCTRFSRGFRYLCEKENCNFEVDVRCAAIPGKLNHKSHTHPLFICLTNEDRIPCWICQRESKFVLYCLQSEFYLCFECATLPDKVIYKHDEHPLILCCGEQEEEEDANVSQYWCETCESKLNPKQWFYKCDDCGVTLHIPCLIGTSPYAKPGPIMIKSSRSNEENERIDHYPYPGTCLESYFELIPIRFEEEFDIIANDTLTRPMCCHCHRRCQYSVVFMQEQDFYCSLSCLCYRKLYNDSFIFPILE